MTENVDQLIYNRNINIANGTDLNTLVAAGFYDGTQLVNAPSADWFHIEVLRHSNTGNTYVVQRATILANSTEAGLAYMRSCFNGTWTNWQRIVVTDTTDSVGFSGSVSSPNFVTSGPAGQYVMLDRHASHTGIMYTDNGALRLWMDGADTFYTTPGGAIWTAQVGDLKTYIDANDHNRVINGGGANQDGVGVHNIYVGWGNNQLSAQVDATDMGAIWTDALMGSGVRAKLIALANSGGSFGSGNLGANIFNVRDYGAVSDGGDASGAFQAAFNALNNSADGGVIYIPPGNYSIQNQIFGATSKPFVVRGAGSATQLVFSGGMANCLVMQQTTPNAALEIHDLQIFVTGATNLGSGSVLSIIGVLQGCDGVQATNIHIRMSEDSPCSNVMLVRNPSSGVLRDINIDGYSGFGASTNATGIYIDCDTQGANGLVLHNCNIFRVYTGIKCVGGQIHAYVMEGFEATECTIVGCQFGLIMQGGWYQPPGMGWRGGHINCAQICIQVNTWSEFKIADTLLYLDGSSQANPQGFISISGSDDVNVHNCTTRYVDEINGAATTRDIYGVAIQNSSNIVVQNNFFDIGRPNSAAVYSVQGNSNVRTGFNTKRGGGTFLANSDGAARSIVEDIVV